jgi:hypothetical protein
MGTRRVFPVDECARSIRTLGWFFEVRIDLTFRPAATTASTGFSAAVIEVEGGGCDGGCDEPAWFILEMVFPYSPSMESSSNIVETENARKALNQIPSNAVCRQGVWTNEVWPQQRVWKPGIASAQIKIEKDVT